MNAKNRQIRAGIIVGILLVLAVFFRSAPHAEVDTGYRMLMGTFGRIVAIAPDSPAAGKSAEAGFAELVRIDELMSDYKPDSELAAVNQNAFKSPVMVSQPTFDVLTTAHYFSQLTEGAFDVTVGPLVDLWRRAADANSIPTETELQQARAKVGYEKLILDANEMTARFAVDGMRLDLGGIAKGYAVDKAIEAMKKRGALGGMVDIGGDIRCFGTPPKSKETWLIGLQDPNSKDWIGTTRPSLVLKLNDQAIATSGDYRRFALIDGKKYSHIIDSKSGYASPGLASVTIIAKEAVDADALATAVSVLGPQKGLDLIENLPQTEAILISPGPEFRLNKTTGAGVYMK
jgi:thiamine biosynthesis lipoprotein